MLKVENEDVFIEGKIQNIMAELALLIINVRNAFVNTAGENRGIYLLNETIRMSEMSTEEILKFSQEENEHE